MNFATYYYRDPEHAAKRLFKSTFSFDRKCHSFRQRPSLYFKAAKTPPRQLKSSWGVVWCIFRFRHRSRPRGVSVPQTDTRNRNKRATNTTRGEQNKKIILINSFHSAICWAGPATNGRNSGGGKGGETSPLARRRRKVLGKALKATYLKQHRRQDNAHRVPAGGIGASLAKNTFGRNALSLSGPHKASTHTKTEDQGRR